MYVLGRDWGRSEEHPVRTKRRLTSRLVAAGFAAGVTWLVTAPGAQAAPAPLPAPVPPVLAPAPRLQTPAPAPAPLPPVTIPKLPALPPPAGVVVNTVVDTVQHAGQDVGLVAPAPPATGTPQPSAGGNQ